MEQKQEQQYRLIINNYGISQWTMDLNHMRKQIAIYKRQDKKAGRPQSNYKIVRAE